jgi:hypothetical protein
MLRRNIHRSQEIAGCPRWQTDGVRKMAIWKKIIAAYIASAGAAGPFVIGSYY